MEGGGKTIQKQSGFDLGEEVCERSINGIIPSYLRASLQFCDAIMGRTHHASRLAPQLTPRFLRSFAITRLITPQKLISLTDRD